jgi:hypothetical protein
MITARIRIGELHRLQVKGGVHLVHLSDESGLGKTAFLIRHGRFFRTGRNTRLSLSFLGVAGKSDYPSLVDDSYLNSLNTVSKMM